MAAEGGAAVSAFLQVLCEDLRAIIATSKLSLVVNDELGRLLKTFHEIPPTTVEAAEDQALKSKLLRAWLRELKEVAYDAADLLDHLDDLQAPDQLNNDVMEEEVIPRCHLCCIFHSCCTLGSSSTLQHPADETVLMISALRKRVKKLMRKHSKEVLHLQPPIRRDIESNGAVLQGLRPNPNIKELTIRYNHGPKIPIWLEDGSLINLETLEIFEASIYWDLSLLGQLKSLKKLEARSFLKLPHFDRWKEEDDSQRFPCLQKLYLTSCTSLKESTYLPLTLEVMQLSHIGWRTLPRLQQNRNHTSSSSLTSLYISDCYRLTTLQVGLLEHRNQYQLQALHDLVIMDCSELSYLPDHGFSALVSLKTLRIENCRKLRYRPVENGSALLPSSLLDFKLIKCGALTNDSFFMGMGKLHSLASMEIQDDRLRVDDDHSPEETIFTSLPCELLQHFKSIKELEIACCESLEILGLQALLSLKCLKIYSCKNLVACSSSASSPPILLEYLVIENSPLQMLSGELLRSLTNLQELKIMRCHELESFPNAMNEDLHCLASLERLYIDQCHELRSLPHELATIPSLEELIITSCRSIESLPENGLPASLVMLIIRECPYLKKSCTKEGEDWSKISHVFYIEVDGRNVNEAISSKSASFKEEEGEE
ncbi:hypothetical protein J5N97_006423 [Dioscorea zingiberensis]|uniref:Rx N-terminal domain-containing protein n=1 Tax=Dioscorea zingiberensis TaxID=325984 RepID=A0A9D5HU07_9LILI|nr:hypothetical protein J5N97_006423 [Dioscorea zingiberensis]